GDRSALPRQQTLRALIDWSYELLSADERTLLARLGVFYGGFTLEAAEAVVPGDSIENQAVLDLVSNLVEKSLVSLDRGGERYRLLETVRQYAQERLDASGKGDATRSRHLEHFLAFAERARPQLIGSEQAAWLDRLDAERENLLAAHAWCAHAEEGAERDLRLAAALRRYWIVRGLPAVGYRLVTEALARPDAQGHAYERCLGLFDAGQLCSWMGRYREAQQHLEQSLAIARDIGDRRSIAAALQPLGMAHQGLGEFDQARRYMEEALAMARDLGEQREIACALVALAQVHRGAGSADQAEPLYAEALALGRALADREVVCVALLNLAMVSIGRSSCQGMAPMLQEALAIAEEIGSRQLAQSVLDVSAGLAASLADWTSAARLYGAAERVAKETGLQRDRADEGFLAPLVGRAREALGEAAYKASLAAGYELGYEGAIAELGEWLGRQPG
ncbi:MAG: tetratricopeptide repeat protein, partial [Hyphomicrobiales bacterium]|nr:tetratricopeptide repeat protein [Hyphomicrobiales bacterium]